MGNDILSPFHARYNKNHCSIYNGDVLRLRFSLDDSGYPTRVYCRDRFKQIIAYLAYDDNTDNADIIIKRGDSIHESLLAIRNYYFSRYDNDKLSKVLKELKKSHIESYLSDTYGCIDIMIDDYLIIYDAYDDSLWCYGVRSNLYHVFNDTNNKIYKKIHKALNRVESEP